MFAEAVRSAASRLEVIDGVTRVYEALQREIDQRRPRCVASGRCCRFEECEHRLFVTTLELAAFVTSVGEGERKAVPGGCPFQAGGLCSVHAHRPFGCRIFFCDATADEWQKQQYERFLGELKRLHERLEVPYYYVEWRQGLQALGIMRPPDDGGPPGCLSPTQIEL